MAGKGAVRHAIAGPQQARALFELRREALSNTPIENLSFFSVKKKGSNPQIPEPTRMLLPQKNDCKSFLIFILRNVGVHSSGTSTGRQIPFTWSGVCGKPWNHDL
jgi:hypothetical protein